MTIRLDAKSPDAPVDRQGEVVEVSEGTASGAPVARTVVRQRKWGLYLSSAVVLFLLAQFLWSLVTVKNYNWGVFAEYFFNDAILRGLQLTLTLTVVSIVGGFILGAVLALMRLSSSPILNAAAFGYVWFFRSVPLLVQILLWYNLGYLYPTLGLGTPFTTDFWLYEVQTTALISAFFAAALGLTLHQAAYSAEIIRAGILSVDAGQREAAAALGIPASRRFFRIILPQAARSIVSNAFNEIIGQVKGTSVVFVVALPELFYTVQVIYNRTSTPIPLLMVSVAWYALITTALSILQYYVERHYAKGAERELPPTPFQKLRAWSTRTWRALADDSPPAPVAPPAVSTTNPKVQRL
ncbi:amino acid ABC transporter permease [Corynebacterium pacaense]|uniref:amino acid ABC transporter permease n=1 Tax=Corynebacterium pacaense TaxID=1816684 RepID=UPI0009B94773|nr:amino acid ABC transporter permease [Corynebacterium pacaense]